ncbi:hypothetical protein [uncultured Bacteroides sp.]|uniref:hypothetical protein n=1 Tax=uncultured Bacteroides sp. TaxID=162156 RepID=UPI0026762398|nr:hypothetical protein [uncultured Bacteroides sp.]
MPVKFLFTDINTSQRLSNNLIRYIFLTKNRIPSSGNMNLYVSMHTGQLHRTAECVYPSERYDGYYHIIGAATSFRVNKQLLK